MTSVALFNNKGGVGKTTLVYHLAHMYQRLGKRVLAVDLDPQSNLTSSFLDEEDLAHLWDELEPSLPGRQPAPISRFPLGEIRTIAQAVDPIVKGTGDVRSVDPVEVTENLWLVPGDLELSRFEDQLASSWGYTFSRDNEKALRTTTAFYRVIQEAGRRVDPQIILIDVGPNLGAINRAALLSADTVLMPLAADLFSLRGLRNLGPTLRAWREDWKTVLKRAPEGLEMPGGHMLPLGYVIMQPEMRLDRPVMAYQRWTERIPVVYDRFVLEGDGRAVGDEHEIATLRNYRSLMPLAHDARKPMFDLRAADGALGSTQSFVQTCYRDFKELTAKIDARLALADQR